MERVCNFVRDMNLGSTNPSLVEASDGNLYVLKCLNEECNGKGLFNELVASRLVSLLKVPMPRTKLLLLDDEIIKSNSFFLEINALKGVCFGSEYIVGSAGISPPMLKKIINHCDIPTIILFDQIIMNQDRSPNPGNLFYDKKAKKLIAIDHSHIFRNGLIWESGHIDDLSQSSPVVVNNLMGILYRYCSPYINGNSPFGNILKTVDNLSPDDINAIFIDIPDEWSITEKEIKAVKSFVEMQISNIHGIITKMRPSFENWKGDGTI